MRNRYEGSELNFNNVFEGLLYDTLIVANCVGLLFLRKSFKKNERIEKLCKMILV